MNQETISKVQDLMKGLLYFYNLNKYDDDELRNDVYDLDSYMRKNPVQVGILKIENGKLGDIAPTILKLMGIEQPEAMTRHSLV